MNIEKNERNNIEFTDAKKLYDFLEEKKIAPLKKYMEEMHFQDEIVYEYEYDCSSITIYSKNPAIWIGHHGDGIKKLKKLLHEEWGHDAVIIIKHLKGGLLF